MEEETGLEGVQEVASVEQPVEQPAASQEAEVQPPAEYELPDGKKVDAATLAKEWKENFLPEYTRKSQDLAALKAKAQPVETRQPIEAPWTNPEWAPGNYGELAQGLEQQIWQRIADSAAAEEQAKQQQDAYIAQEIEQVQSLDPKADVNRVMSHAAKYGFPSLIPAYQNMKATEDALARQEERIMKNIQSRASEPVGTSKVSGGGLPTFPPHVKSPMEKARWIVRNQ